MITARLSVVIRGVLTLAGLAGVTAVAGPALADDACPPAGVPSSGYRPVMPSEIACATKLAKPITVALLCKLEIPSGHAYVVPGMKVNVLGPARISLSGVRVKTPDGKEGDVDHSCLSWSSTGVSLMPNPKAKNTSATIKTIIKQLYAASKAIRKEMFTTMQKRDFMQPKAGTPDERLMSAMVNANENYGKLMHDLIHGSNVSTTNLLELDENRWMADWPDVVVDTYSKGLGGKDKAGAEAAEDAISKRAQILTFARERADLKEDEASADDKVKRLPEAKRQSEKKKMLDEIATKRKDLTKKMNEWEKDADNADKKVRL